MQEYKVILTWEAVYDITQMAEYIETKFGSGQISFNMISSRKLKN